MWDSAGRELGQGSFLFWRELYVNPLPWLSATTLDYSQGCLVDFRSSLSPLYAKIKNE